jgi:hypothetical protein
MTFFIIAPATITTSMGFVDFTIDNATMSTQALIGVLALL